MLPIIVSCAIYLKLICIKRRVFLNKVGVIQSEGATTTAQQASINFKQETQVEPQNFCELQTSSKCSKIKNAVNEEHNTPCSAVCESQEEDTGMDQPNNIGAIENKTYPNNKKETRDTERNLDYVKSIQKFEICGPVQNESNHPKISTITVLMASEDIQVLSEEHVDNTGTNTIDNQTTSIQILNKTELDMEIFSRDNLSKDSFSKDKMQKDSLSKDAFTKDILPKQQEEDKNQAQLAAASRSMKTNLNLGSIFILLLIIFLLIPEFWRPYLNAILFTLNKGLMPILTAIANFGTVKFVALQYLDYVQNVWNLVLSKIQYYSRCHFFYNYST